MVPGTRLADLTSLGIGGTTDLLRIKRHESLPHLLNLLDANHVPHKFLGGGSNLLVGDGELPWVVLQFVRPEPDVVLDGNLAHVDAADDLGRMMTFCGKNTLGGMEGLIGVPGTVGGALRMNAGAYGMQIGSYVREVKLYRAAGRKIEVLRGDQISFEYRHTSFAPDDMMLTVILELPSKPFKVILEGIRICNEKRRSSQPLGQKRAGCIFKHPPSASAHPTRAADPPPRRARRRPGTRPPGPPPRRSPSRLCPPASPSPAGRRRTCRTSGRRSR